MLIRLRRLALIIREHGVEYERNKFAQKLAAGTVTLQTTKVSFFSVLRVSV